MRKTHAHKGLEDVKLVLEKKISGFNTELEKLNHDVAKQTAEFSDRFELNKLVDACLIDCWNPTSYDFTQDWVFV